VFMNGVFAPIRAIFANRFYGVTGAFAQSAGSIRVPHMLSCGVPVGRTGLGCSPTGD
jgi:hypothetical protein